MTDLGDARWLVERLEGELAGNLAEIERLRERKRGPALQAAKGGDAAAAKLAKLNGEIGKLQVRCEDLGSALEQARQELAAAEAAERLALDRERADEVERLAGELAESAAAIDAKLAELAAAFGRRKEIADHLYALAPSLRRDAALRLTGRAAGTRAARRVGLTEYMDLAWCGERHHEVALRSLYPCPEVTALVARLRGAEGSPAGREAA